MSDLGEFLFWLWTDLDEWGHARLAEYVRKLAIRAYRAA